MDDKPTIRDWIWGAVAVVFMGLALYGLVQLPDQVQTHGAEILWWSPVWVLVYFWLIAGSWRRTVWGRSERRKDSEREPVH